MGYQIINMDIFSKVCHSNLFATPMSKGRELSAASTEETPCEIGSTKYYALCGFGGLLSCGITHTAVTPLDLVKCRLQVNKEKYKTLGNGFKLTVQESGASGLFLGWAPTAIGYSMQGICKFGFYEFFKNVYGGILGEENTYLYKTSLYLAASASAEFFADIALSPMESCKVRIQTSAIGTFPTTLREAAPKIYAAEGLNGFYKSLVPLWGRQIPYTMMSLLALRELLKPCTHMSFPNHGLNVQRENSSSLLLLLVTLLEYFAQLCLTLPTLLSPTRTKPREQPLALLLRPLVLVVFGLVLDPGLL